MVLGLIRVTFAFEFGRSSCRARGFVAYLLNQAVNLTHVLFRFLIYNSNAGSDSSHVIIHATILKKKRSNSLRAIIIACEISVTTISISGRTVTDVC